MRFEMQGNCKRDRLHFSRIVIQKELGFSPTQIDYIFGLPGKKSYEVIFATIRFLNHVLTSLIDLNNQDLSWRILRGQRYQAENPKL